MVTTVGDTERLYWSVQLDGAETKEVFEEAKALEIFKDWSKQFPDREVTLVEMWAKVVRVNRVPLNAGVTSISEEDLEALKEQGRAQLAQYPQYKGKFDELIPVIMSKDIRTKAGFAFEKGEIVLLDTSFDDPCLYSFKTTNFTVVSQKDFKLLEVLPPPTLMVL